MPGVVRVASAGSAPRLELFSAGVERQVTALGDGRLEELVGGAREVAVGIRAEPPETGPSRPAAGR